MAMKCFPTSDTAERISSQKYRYNDMVSTVPPDLLETMKSVLPGSIVSITCLTSSGYVESRTVRSGCPSAAPNVLRNMHGAMLEPPMPRRTALVMPSSHTCLTTSIMSSNLRAHSLL